MVEVKHDLFEPVAYFANHVCFRNLHAVELDVGSAARPNPHAVHLAHRDAGYGFFNQQHGKAFVRAPGRSRPHRDGEVIRVDAVRDPLFVSVIGNEKSQCCTRKRCVDGFAAVNATRTRPRRSGRRNPEMNKECVSLS